MHGLWVLASELLIGLGVWLAKSMPLHNGKIVDNAPDTIATWLVILLVLGGLMSIVICIMHEFDYFD